MLISLLFLNLLSQPSVVSKPVGPTAEKCAVSGYAETNFEKLRPFPEVTCEYSVDEFHERLLSIFHWPKQALDIETVERAFLLPRLKTAYDAPRSSSYTAYVSHASIEKGWRTSINYDESFFPTDAWRRPRFRGAERPVLINPRIRGERRVSIELHPAKGDSTASADCLDIAAVRGTAIHQGWSEAKLRILNMPLHGGPITLPPVQFYQGRWSIDVQLDGADKCVREITYRSEADKGAN